jgi:short-subunit dehydrogenase
MEALTKKIMMINSYLQKNNRMKKTALITGASSGIGFELAKIHASKGGDLVLVARNKKILDELKTELENNFQVKVYCIGKDLSAVTAAQELYEETTKENIQIDYLINNAGFGDFGMFSDSDWNKELQMINLNITSLTAITKLYLKDMLKRKSWQNYECSFYGRFSTRANHGSILCH